MPRPKPDMNFLLNKYFISKGLEIISPEESTFNVTTMISIKCKNNKDHIYKMSIGNIRKGKYDPLICPHCIKNQKYNEMGIPKSEVEDYCKLYNLDYEPKQDFYNKWLDSLTLICQNKHKKVIKSLNHWSKNKKDYICEECEKEKLGLLPDDKFNDIVNNIKFNNNNTNIQLEDTKFNKEITLKSLNYIKSRGNWHIVEYNGTKNNSKFICKTCGYTREVLVFSLDNCAGCRNIINKTRIYEKIKEICKEYNIFPVNKNNIYEDFDNPIKLKCNTCGHEFEYTWVQINGRFYKINCPNCYKSIKRKEENELYNFISSIYPIEKVQQNNKTIIAPKELDIFIEEKKLAIEFCGNVWHCEKFIEDKNYHYNKYKSCLEKNIKLITLFEDEWVDKKEICQSRIKNLLGLNEYKIYARECEIIEISKEEITLFCDINHIQGNSKATTKAYGLKYNNVIVSVMGFNECIESRKGDWELNRFCSLLNYNVIGAFGKLLKKFRNDHPNSLLNTYSDNRWGNGDVYKNNGFELKTELPVRYYYVGNMTGWKRKHRFNFNKERLIELFGNSDETEHAMALKNKLYRIYDCGYKKWILKTS